jgi:FtsP/CotA-like multicopper oxidase with cupredoxin domain
MSRICVPVDDKEEHLMNTSHTMHHDHATDDQFNREIGGLPAATPTQINEVSDGETFDLIAAPVRKPIGGTDVRLLAYNGSVPGPTIRVRQGSTVTVNFLNQADLENTVHWHGVRLENRFDGTHETQSPVPVGGSFSYQVHFPDPGVYWYHPHIREDYGQEMGLYGNILVVPTEQDYWPAADRELALTLDDILLEDGKVAPFSRTETTYAAMGRFGNVLLVNGEPDLSLTARRGEVVRLYLTNTANTRVFNVGVSGARMKLVGGDSGHCEHEAFVETALVAPSERVVVDVLFDEPGTVTLQHHTPDKTYSLATIAVNEDRALPSYTHEFMKLRSNPDLMAERDRLGPYLAAEPDKTLAFVAEMNLGTPAAVEGAVIYTCPMHPEVTSDEPGRCPKCGMNLVPKAVSEVTTTYTCPMHPEVVSDKPGSCPICGMKLLPSALVDQSTPGSEHHDMAMHQPEGHEHHDQHGHHHDESHSKPSSDPNAHEHQGHHQTHADHGDDHQHAGHGTQATEGIEWEDDMVAINRMTTPANMRWTLVDRATGAQNHAIDWHFRVGDRIKIRLVNEMDSDHPMHHPFHIHGAGRFLILSRDGVVEPNLMWKDTVLVRTGQTVDILLDVTNPGVWMAHCHIAEHHESGMMMSFHVAE